MHLLAGVPDVPPRRRASRAPPDAGNVGVAEIAALKANLAQVAQRARRGRRPSRGSASSSACTSSWASSPPGPTVDRAIGSRAALRTARDACRIAESDAR